MSMFGDTNDKKIKFGETKPLVRNMLGYFTNPDVPGKAALETPTFCHLYNPLANTEKEILDSIQQQLDNSPEFYAQFVGQDQNGGSGKASATKKTAIVVYQMEDS
jgi:hypothetical protein